MSAASSSDRLLPIQRNKAGKRVDKSLLVEAEGNYMTTLEEANMCLGYHLRGKCDSKTCSKNHTKIKYHLTDEAFEGLWFTACSELY